MSRVELRHGRIIIDGQPQLVLAGEVHYFRLDPADWAERLRALRAANCDTVATYVPWVWHELPDGTIDLTGASDPRRDVAGFLDLAHSLGLRAIVRPGPYVMAELKNEGVPYRLFENPDLVPETWDGSPVPNATLDYSAPGFLSEVDGWYAAVMPVFAERLIDRGGPVIAVQLDNEVGMLSWVTNAPPNGKPLTLAEHDEFARSLRAQYAEYFAALRASAERHGVRDVPFLINVHGTGDGRGRTYPIGLSQLRDAYHGVPGVASGTDLYLGDLTVGNVADLYVANAFTAATNGPDQPLTSLEFECGSGDYSEDFATLIPPEAIELKTRLAVAQGNRLLNYYLFAGGRNPVLGPHGDGTSLIAITGERHGFAAPIDPEGRLTPGYHAIAAVAAALRPFADVLADSTPEYDDLALGLVRDHYLTEYRNPASAERAEQVADLERFRGMGSRDVLARALVLGGFSFPAVDLQTSAPLPRVVALGSPRTLGAEVQRRLAEHVLGGGSLLLHGVLPDRDFDGSPCTILADALGVRGGRFVPAGHGYFTSVAGAGGPEVRVGYAQLLSSAAAGEPPLSSAAGGSPLSSAAGEPLLVEVGSGQACAYQVEAGAGRAVILAADYPCHLDFWRARLAWLGVTPGLRVEPDNPGVVALETVDSAGRRLLHLINVAPSAAEFSVLGRFFRLPARSGLIQGL